MRSNSHALSVVPAFVALLAACSADGAAGPNAHQVSLSFTTAARLSPAMLNGLTSGSLTQTVGSNTLVITKAQIVLKRIELTTSSTTDCTADNTMVSGDMSGGTGGPSGHPECDEVRADPAVVDLPVDGSVTTSAVATVAAGTYSAFEARIHAVRGTDTVSTNFLTANPTFAGVSVHVEGTYNGTNFTYDGRSTGMIELAFSPPVTVTTGGINITVNADLSTWFVDGSGNLIDPSTAGSGGANEMLVGHNIHESFEAFEDDHHDGHPDHH